MKVWDKSKPHPKTAVFIGRPTKYGNPFPITSTQNREEVILKYADYLSENPYLVKAMKQELDGKDLICFCSPEPCHGDVIKFFMEQENSKIQGFFGEYRWLSNFCPVSIPFNGYVYPSVEHAYQAAKCLYPIQEEMIRNKPTAADTKRAIKHMTIKPDFHKHKLGVMEALLAEKFTQEPFRTKLLKTGDLILEETNFWKDYYWGVCGGKGENHLGILIMNIRQLLKD